MPGITPFMWFDHQAEEAASYYVSTFPRSKIVRIDRYGEASAKASGRPVGSVMTVAFELRGQPFIALNGGPHYKISGGISFVADCDTQDEIDALWHRLSDGGEAMVCGWVKDRFGVTWQVIPSELDAMLRDADPAKVAHVWQALLKMSKPDLAALRLALDGG